MGEEQKMACGTLWVATEGGEPVKLCNFDEVETYSDEENDDYRAILYSHEDISAPIEASFTIPPQLWPRLRKFFSGFDRCKGPGRYKAIAKCLKYMQKAYRVDEKYLRMLVKLGYIPVNEELSCPVDLYGLPCTDIWEYLWFRMAVVEDAAEYMDYRCEKIKRTIRSKHRQRR